MNHASSLFVFPPFAGPRARLVRAVSCGLVASMLAACATRAPEAPAVELPLPEASAAALDRLMPQVASGPAWITALMRRSVAVEPLHRNADGDQTLATVAARGALIERLRAAYPQVELLSMNGPMARTPTWVIGGVIDTGRARAEGANGASPTLTLVLTDAASGAVLAQTRVPVRADSIDNTPTPFFKDSPVLTGPAAAAAATAPTKPRLDAAALIDQGTNAYDEGRYADSLAAFEAAAKLEGADPMLVQTGLYLAHTRLGQPEPAMHDFSRIVEIGIARRSLAVKFLFQPGQVEFWADPKVSGPYAMWLDQIALRAKSARACLGIVGHSSHTGSAEFNDRLSLDRAIRIGDALRQRAPELGLRLQETGMGFRENLIGTGTDDARDALDRRVEFRFDGC